MNRLPNEFEQSCDDWVTTRPAQGSGGAHKVPFLVLGLGLLLACGLCGATEPKEKAWNILEEGVAEKNAIKRADAVEALGLLSRDVRARTIAEKALGDDNPRVRAAAAIALGDMRSSRSIPKLTEALSDKDPLVVLSAAHSLLLLHKRPSDWQKAVMIYSDGDTCIALCQVKT